MIIQDENHKQIVLKALENQIICYNKHIKICNILNDDELVSEANDKIAEVEELLITLKGVYNKII